MTQLDDARRQSRAPREHVSTLIAALRRIHATLDLDTVLGEVVESTRALTGARYGVSVTLDEAGAPQDPMFSGLAPEEERKRFAWPGDARLSGHLGTLAEPLRVADFPAGEYGSSAHPRDRDEAVLAGKSRPNGVGNGGDSGQESADAVVVDRNDGDGRMRLLRCHALVGGYEGREAVVLRHGEEFVVVERAPVAKTADSTTAPPRCCWSGWRRRGDTPTSRRTLTPGCQEEAAQLGLRAAATQTAVAPARKTAATALGSI